MASMRTSGRPIALFIRSLGLLPAAAVALSSGCVGYNSYSPPDDEYSIKHGFQNPNSDPFPPIMTEAVRWVITRYPSVERAEWAPPLGVPPEGAEFAVNLPVGVNRLVYSRVVDRIGFGAVPLDPSTEHLPTYHVGRIWVTGDEAKVEVIRPVPGIKNPDGTPATQGMTVRLRGGLQPWRVTSHRVWALNTMPLPPINYIEEPPPAYVPWSNPPEQPEGRRPNEPAPDPDAESAFIDLPA